MKLRFKNPFKEEESLEDLQQREEVVTTQLSIAEKETLIKKVEAEGKKWEMFSEDGTKKGINYQRILAFLRGSKGGKK